MKSAYFDYAAATPISEKSQSAMKPFMEELFYNPSALYTAAQKVKQSIQEARKLVASELGCKSSEIIFTAGGTESDNLAIKGVMEQFPQGNVVISAVEHDAVTVPAKQFEHKICAVQSNGRIDVEALRSLIDDKTVLVSVMYANNEIGTIQPIHDIAKIIKKILIERKIKASSSNNFKALPIYLHTDACQAANYLPLLTNTLGVDLMTLNGGKIYGPKQSGILYVRTGLVLSTQILGGGQERSFRSGTENVAGIVGFAASLKEAGLMRFTESDRLRQLSELFINKLAEKVPNTIVNGSIKHRLPNNIHITVPGCDNERLMMELDERGLMVATGSACSASSDEPSHVLKAIGLSDAHAYSSLRITFGRQTTEAEVRQLVNNLSDIVAK